MYYTYTTVLYCIIHTYIYRRCYTNQYALKITLKFNFRCLKVCSELRIAVFLNEFIKVA